jgi:site-specific recombinase XerD
MFSRWEYQEILTMNTQLETITSNPSTVIETLLANDPRLISKHTTRQYRADLMSFEAWRAGRTITKTLVEEYAASLQAEGRAPNTINQRLAAIRWYARKIADLAIDYGSPEDAQQAARVATVRDVKGERPERGRHIEQGELSALIEACTADTSPAGIRDAAIIALAWSTGLRRDEISRIELADLTNSTDDSIDIGIIGKGEKVRTVYVNDGAFAALMDWIDRRGNADGSLFVDVNKAGKIGTGKLSGEALRKMLDKRSQEAKLSKPVTWHDFRRTFAGNLWDAKIDGVTIQKLMGHASQNQTAKYDRRPEATRRAAVKVLHVPYTRTMHDPMETGNKKRLPVE